QDDREIFQCRGDLGLGLEGLFEHGEVDPVGHFGPIGGAQRKLEIIVEDCTAQPRHLKGPSWRGGRPEFAVGEVAMVARYLLSRKLVGLKNASETPLYIRLQA